MICVVPVHVLCSTPTPPHLAFHATGTTQMPSESADDTAQTPTYRMNAIKRCDKGVAFATPFFNVLARVPSLAPNARTSTSRCVKLISFCLYKYPTSGRNCACAWTTFFLGPPNARTTFRTVINGTMRQRNFISLDIY